MKKLLFLLLAITCYSGSVWAQSPGWAKRFGGQSVTSGMATTVDDSGNVYTVGTLAGRDPADFDPGIDTFYLEPDGISYSDIFISKLDSSGKFVWAKRIGAKNTDQPYSMVIDDSANIYITGYFSDTVDFDPGPGVFNLPSAGDDDVFIVKLNVSGELVWAKRLGSSFRGERAYGIALDDSANVHVTGTFSIGLDFDPGPGVFNVSVKGQKDVFILKLTTGGNFVWAKTIGGYLGSADAFGITVSDSGNVYVTGYHNHYTIDMDPGSGVYNFTTQGSYILKLKGNGNFVWARQVGGISTFSHSVTDGGIVVDKMENVVATGYFVGTGDFDPDAGVYNMTSLGGLNVFILKLNGNGQFQWAGKIGGNQSGLAARGLDLDPAGNIYVSGGFSDTADFDPQPSVFNVIPSGESNVFLLKLNPSGSMKWMRKIGGGETAFAYRMKIHSDNIYYAGTFKDTIDIDPGPDSVKIWMHPNGINDAFVSKLKSASGLLSDPLPDADFSATVTSPCIGSSIVFTDQSVYASTWDWKFTPATITYFNNTNSSSMQPAVTFNSAGDYMVKLTVTNSSSLDSVVKTAYINVLVSPVPFIGILATDTIICDSELVVFTSDTLNGGAFPSYQWKINQTIAGTSFSLSSHHLKNNDTITCMFTSSARCALPAQVVSKRVVMNVNPVPALPFIYKMNNVLSCDLGGMSYTWYFNNAVINGANGQSYTVTQNGTYKVEVTNPQGCSSISANFPVTNTGIAGVKHESGFTMYPNPSGSVIYLEYTREGNDRTYTISDAAGAVVLKGTANTQLTKVDIVHLATGLYFVQLEGGNVLKLVKQ